MRTDLEPMCEKNLQVPLDSLTNRAPHNRLPPAERHPFRSQQRVPAPLRNQTAPFAFFAVPFRWTTSAQRGPHARADGDALAAARNPAEARSSPSNAYRQTAVFWPRNRVLAQLRRNTLQKESNDLGFSELPDPDHPENSRKPRPNVPERGFVAKIERSSRTDGSVSRRRRSRTIVEHPSRAPSRKNDSRPHPQACTPLASRRPSRFIGRYHVPQRKKPPANTKGSARSISTAETAPLRQNPLPRSAPIANPVRRQPARSNLRRVCDGSTGKACRNRIGFALESRWNRSGAA